MYTIFIYVCVCVCVCVRTQPGSITTQSQRSPLQCKSTHLTLALCLVLFWAKTILPVVPAKTKYMLPYLLSSWSSMSPVSCVTLLAGSLSVFALRLSSTISSIFYNTINCQYSLWLYAHFTLLHLPLSPVFPVYLSINSNQFIIH